jgi:hypothetical protein
MFAGRKMTARLVHWLGVAVALGSGVFASAANAQSVTAVEGILTAVWADVRPGFGKNPGDDMRFNVTLADGATIPLDVAPWDRTTAIRAFGKRVRLEGRPAAASPVVGGASGRALTVDKLTLLEDTAPKSVAAAVTTATKRVLFVLVKFAGDTQAPHAPAFYKALANPLTPNSTLHIPATINGYFAATSWNQLRWQADVVGATGLASTDWLTLPGPKSAYANCGWGAVCFNYIQLTNDALALVQARGVNITAYSNINFVVNNDLDCCAWGGGVVYQNKVYGATWEPPWGQEAGVYVHEMGHSLGLPHSGWRYYAYDSPWDDMSSGSAAQRVQCGSYRSANSSNANNALYCTEPGAGYITAHKDALSWIPAANKVLVDTITTRTVALEANGSPLGTAAKMIKICLPGVSCTGSTARFLTVEARMRTTSNERGLPNEGVIVHDVQMARKPVGAGNACFFNTSSGWAMPFDATGGDYAGAPACNSGGRTYPNYALFNAQYDVGRPFVWPTYGLRVDVLGRTATGYSVRVTRTK